MVIPDTYKGSPLICYEPDVILVSEKTFNQYKDSFKIEFNKVKLIFI